MSFYDRPLNFKPSHDNYNAEEYRPSYHRSGNDQFFQGRPMNSGFRGEYRRESPVEEAYQPRRHKDPPEPFFPPTSNYPSLTNLNGLSTNSNVKKKSLINPIMAVHVRRRPRHEVPKTTPNYVYETLIRRVNAYRKQQENPDDEDQKGCQPANDNKIVESQSWLPYLESKLVKVNLENYLDEDEFGEQLTDVLGIKTVSANGTFKLYYFEIRDLGEPIRLLLHFVGQPFSDIRFTDEDWIKEHKKFECHRLPVLDHDGFRLSHAVPIAKYLADLFGLAGKDRRDIARIDEFIEVHLEAMAEFSQFIRVMAEKEKGDGTDLLFNVAKPASDRFFPIYRRSISCDGFITGSTPTWADFFISDFLFTLNGMAPELFVDYPDLVQYTERVLFMERLKDYVRKRHNTVM